MSTNNLYKVKRFDEYNGEYRKGSTKFGDLVESIMTWLRIYKNQENKASKITVNIDKFLKETNLKIEDIKEFISSDNNLVSWKITLEDDKIIIDDLNKSKKQRFIWE